MSVTLQKAVVLDGTYAKVVEDRPIPALRPGYILVQVKAVALNPTDWKSISHTNTAGATGGCDFSGIVEKTGTGYDKEWKVGDRVAGMAFGNNSQHLEDGAFAEHILVRADMALHIPDDMSFKAAATLGVGSNTVGQALFSRQGLGLNYPDQPNQNDEKLFIYGGSTATACFGIQLARIAGYSVYTVCSAQHFDLVKSLGATGVFDYKDPNSIEQIKAAAGGGFKYVWDTITQPASVEYCMNLILPGGYYRNLTKMDIPRKDINEAWTLAYTTLGEPVVKGNVLRKMDVSEDYEDGKKFVAIFEKLLSEGQLKVHPYKVSSDGLEGVLDGLQLLKENKVRGQKLVYTL